MIGQVFRYRYELESRLGEGPLFTTFRGRDRVKSRPVVIKVLQPQFNAMPEMRLAVKAFADAAMQRPARPAIVATWGLDEHEGQLFLVGELAGGPSLDDQLRKVAPMSVPVAVDIAIAILEALDAVHRVGEVHGALRPSDVFVSVDGHVKVSDFGLLRLAEAHPDALRAVRAATGPYLGPEVAAGGETSPSSDVFSVGVILFEMLTGEFPFPPAGREMDGQSAMPLMRTLNPAVSQTLQELVEKAASRAPSFRYRSAEEMLLDLKAIRDSLRFGKPMDWSLKPAQASATIPPPPTTTTPKAAVPQTVIKRPQPEPKPKPPPTARTKSPMEPDVPRWHTMLNLALMILTVVVVMGIAAFLFLNLTKPTEVVVPSIVGKTVAEARVILEGKKLKIKVERQAVNEHFPPDTIYEASPSPGTRVRQGSIIAVNLSLGPKMIQVPNVEGMDIAKARNVLSGSGFENITAAEKEYSDETPPGHVLRQVPPAGRSVDRAQRVALVISQGPEPEPDTTETVTDPASEMHRWTIPVTVPTTRDGDLVEVRVEFRDRTGSRVIYDAFRAPGEEFDVSTEGYGEKATVTVRMNGRRLYRREMRPDL